MEFGPLRPINRGMETAPAKAGSRIRTILVLVSALLAVGVALIAAGRLQADATAGRDAELQLTALRLDLAQIQDVPWGASPDEGDDPEAVREELEGAQSNIEATLARLDRDGDVAIEVPIKRSLTALWGIFALVSRGQGDQASQLSSQAAHQMAEADVALRAAAANYRAGSTRALNLARIEWTSAILVLFAAFAWFYARVSKARDVAERLADENRQLLGVSKKEALTDALTGLGNRRALMATLDASRPGGGGDRLVLALFDLNGFKRYNDRFGHPTGDALLTRLGERLAAAMKGIGTAYRMGGDEFCIVASAEKGTEDALAALAAAALAETGDGYAVECAYGIAVMPDDTSAPNVGLLLADQRMYEHKAAGRAVESDFVATQASAPVPLPLRAPAPRRVA